MKRDLGYLADRIAGLRRAIPRATNEKKIEVARTVHTELVWVTPVDTSQALSNWVLTAGEEWAVFLVGGYRAGEYGSTQAASANQAIMAANQQLALSEVGMPLYITNNAPYIRPLNDGSSMQAPAGFVERAALLGRKKADSGLRLKVNGNYV